MDVLLLSEYMPRPCVRQHVSWIVLHAGGIFWLMASLCLLWILSFYVSMRGRGKLRNFKGILLLNVL